MQDLCGDNMNDTEYTNCLKKSTKYLQVTAEQHNDTNESKFNNVIQRNVKPKGHSEKNCQRTSTKANEYHNNMYTGRENLGIQGSSKEK